MVSGMTLFAAVETGLRGIAEEDAIEEAANESGIHAALVTGEYVGAKSGIALLRPQGRCHPEANNIYQHLFQT